MYDHSALYVASRDLYGYKALELFKGRLAFYACEGRCPKALLFCFIFLLIEDMAFKKNTSHLLQLYNLKQNIQQKQKQGMACIQKTEHHISPMNKSQFIFKFPYDFQTSTINQQ